MNDKKISIIDIALVLLERKRFLIISLLIVSVATVTGTFFLKKHYTAYANLLPSKSSSFSNPLSAIMGDLPITSLMKSFNFLSDGTDNDQLITILESRRMAELVIDKFDLAKRYKFTKKKKYYIEDVITAYHTNLEVFETDLKNITISFTDTSPAFSANVVNFMISQLDSINYELSRTMARNTRQFFEERLKVVKKDMDSAHARLADYQEKNKFLDLEEQVLSSIQALSIVEAQILNTDINAELIKNRYGSSSYEAQELMRNRKALQQKMKEYLDSGSGELIIPLNKTPRLAIEYTYLLRDVKVQEMLHAFLLQNYEQAKLTEANNTPTITVLEYAKIPQKKSRPKRTILCLLIFSVSFILLSLFVMLMKWVEIQKETDTPTYKKLMMIKKYLGLR